VFTWPEGNAWLTERLATPMRERRIHRARGAAGARATRRRRAAGLARRPCRDLARWHGGAGGAAVHRRAPARDPAGGAAAGRRAHHHAPWLVANLQLDQPLLDRPGVAPAWDNVAYGTRGLGYVDAMHQSLRPVPGATVLTAYLSLPLADRERGLLDESWRAWAGRVLTDLSSVHPDLPLRLQRIDLMRYGHAMAVPLPGRHADPSREALRGGSGRIRFAHADLAGYSVFEEAFIAGIDAARAGCRCA
jgi:hypothetical protein